MKRMFKRWLAMVLAVLMVAGTLPTSAWAARMTEDAVAEQPVLDGKNDPVADTQARSDKDDERPEKPIDPDPDKGDLSEVYVTNVDVKTANIANRTGVLAEGTANGSDAVVVLIVPRFVTTAGAGSTAVNWDTSMTDAQFTSSFVTPTGTIGQLNAFAGMPYFYAKTINFSGITKANINWDGTIDVTSNGTENKNVTLSNAAGDFSAFLIEKLSAYATGKTFYAHRSTTEIDLAEGLPFDVYIGGSGSFSKTEMKIPVTTQSLKVEIQTKDAADKSNFQYGARPTGSANGETMYSVVTVTNISGKTLNNVTVTINRSMIVENDKNDTSTPRIGDDDDKGALTLSQEVTTATGSGATQITMEILYGLVKGDPEWKVPTAAGQTNSPSERTLNLGTMDNGDSISFYVAGTRTSARGGLSNIKVNNVDKKDWRSTYSIKATADGVTEPAWDDAGIRWLQNPVAVPKVRLVYGEDGEGTTKGQPIDDRTGDILNTTSNASTNTTKYHTVRVGTTPLEWIDDVSEPGGGYYGIKNDDGTPDTATTVKLGLTVYVDDFATNAKVQDGGSDVWMYKVKLTDDPEGKAEENLGHYMWDTTETGSNKKVSYAYYPYGATVGFYANPTGWDRFSDNVAEGAVSVSGNSLELTNKGAHLNELNANIDAIVYYNLVDIAFFTTFKGTNIETGLGNNLNLSHVHQIAIRKGNTTVATATQDAGTQTSPTYTMNPSGTGVNVLTAQGAFTPWKITLEGGTYTVSVNGRDAWTFDTTNLTKVEGTADEDHIYKIIEMGGVELQIEGAQDSTTSVRLADDLNPNITGAVTVTKDQAATRVLYYPVGTTIAPTFPTVTAPDSPTKVSYNSVDKTPTYNSGSSRPWTVAAFEIASNAGTDGDSLPMIAYFGQIVEFWVYTDGTLDTTTNHANDIYLVDTADTDEKHITVARDTTDLYKYKTATALDGTKTYNVFVHDFNIGSVGKDGTLTLTDSHYNVPLQHVIVTDDSSIGTPDTASYLYVDDHPTLTQAAEKKEAYIPDNVTVKLSHGTKAGYGNGDPAWTATDGVDGTLTAASDTYVTSAGTTGTGTAQTLTAKYSKSTGTVKVKIYLDGTTDNELSDTPVGTGVYLTTSATDSTANAKQMKKDATTPKTGEYSVGDVGGGTYYIWVNGECVDEDGFTLDAGDSKDDLKVQYWTVKVGVSPNAAWGTAKMTINGTAYVTNGTTSSQSKIVLDGTIVSWSDAAANTHYELVQWDDDSSNKTGYSDVTINDTTSHTALFQAKTYKVTYVPNGGTLTNTADGSFTYGYNYPIDREPTRTGYTFDGWTATGGATGTGLKNNAVLTTPTGDVTLTAQWTPIPYTVTWDGNGGGWTSPTATTKTEQRDYDTVIPKYATDPSRTNYTFAGWYADADCTTAVTFVANTSPKVTGNVTYYAGWTRKTAPVTVKVRLNDNATPVTDATVKLTGKTDITSSTTGDYKFENVDFNEGLDAYTVEVSHATYIGTYKKTDVRVTADAGVEITVYYYTLTLNVKQNNSAYYGAVKQDTASITATDYTDTSTSVVYLANTTVNIAARKTDNRYNFKGWEKVEGTSPASTSNSPTTVAIAAKTTLNATFGKDYYDTFLDVTVNDKAHTDSTITADIKSIKLVNKANNQEIPGVSYDDSTGVEHWTVRNVDDAVSAKWVITTVDDGVYERDAVKDGLATETLFGIVIEGGTGGNDSSNTPTLKAQTNSTAADRIVTRADLAATVKLNKTDSGYSWSKWLSKQGGTPADTDTLDTTNHGTSTTTASADGTFKLVSGYTAPADHADLYIKPVYTFTATVKTQYDGNDENPGGAVVLKSTETDKTLTMNPKGTYTVTGLTPGVTYTVWVNGFATDTTVTAPGTKNVPLVKLIGAGYDDSNTAAGGGSVSLKIGTDGPSGASVYVPSGATTDGGKGLNITATATTDTANNYRRRDAGTYSADTATWTKTENAVTWTVGTAATQVFALADLTTKETTITAHFVKQYKAEVSVDPTSGGTATFTDKPANTGTVIDNPATTATVDAGDYVKAVYVPSVGNTLKNWTFEKGTLWTTPDKKAGTDLTSGTATTEKEVYFFPTDSTATLEAKTEAAKYQVEVTVKKDNAAYINDSLKVHLYHETNNTLVLELKDDDKDGVFTGKVEAGTYRIFANGTDLGNVVFTEAAKNFNFSPDDGEKSINSAHTAGDASKLKKELNYYTIVLIVDPDNHTTTPKDSGRVDFGALTGGNHTTAPGASATHTAETIVLAKQAAQDINIRSAPYVTDTKRYRFETWTATKQSTADGAAEIGSFEKDGSNNIYQSGKYNLPAETALKGYTTIDGANEKVLTLTAKMKQQYKVTLERPNYADITNSTTVSLGGKSSGNSASVSDWFDDGATVAIDAATSQNPYTAVSGGNTIPAFKWWTRVSGAGTFTNAAAGDATKGTKQSDSFTVNGSDATIRLELWKRAQIVGTWTYDRADPAKDSAPGTGSGKVGWLKWTANNGQEPAYLTVTGTGYTLQLKENEHYTVTRDTDNNLTGFQFKDRTDGVDNSYLDKLANGTYTVTATYTQGNTDGGANQYENQTVEATFVIQATVQALTKVDIQVADGEQIHVTPGAFENGEADTKIHGSKTANIDDSTTPRNAVRYEDHTVDIVPKVELRYQWYYADTAPAARPAYRTNTTTNATAKSQAETYLNGVKNTIKWVAIPVTDPTADTLDLTNKTELKGKYVFALVWVVDGSDGSTASTVADGAVITNAIQVDYDATVTLYQDKNTNPVKDAQTGYAVYLWPTDGGTFNQATAIEATHTSADGTDTGEYTTKGSKLTAGKKYHVYVLETEGMDKTVSSNYVQLKNGNSAVEIAYNAPTTSATYYTVSVTDMSASSTFTHAATNSGETFDAYPTFTATTTKGAKITNSNNGKGVLAGTSVTTKVNALSGKSVGWEPDYTLVWQDMEGEETSFADTASNLTQNSTTAVSTGYDYTTSLANKVNFTGRMTQNTYKLAGVIKDVDGRSGTQSGEVATATLTIKLGENTVTYTGVVDGSGRNGDTVTFTVPRTTGDNRYELTSTVKALTTHKGYYEGNGNITTDVPATPQTKLKLETALDAGVPGSTVSNRFTIYVVRTDLAAQLADKDTHDTGKVSGTSRTTHTVKTDDGSKIVFNYDAFTKVVTVTNKGNTPLTLTPKLYRKALTAADTAFAATSLTNGADDKGATFVYTGKIAADGTKTAEATNLTMTAATDAFTLQPDERREVTITIPKTWENKDDYTYRLDFDAKDGRDGTTQGPIVGYILNVEIEPVTLGRVTAELKDDGAFHVQRHWLMDDAASNGTTANDDFYKDVNNSAEALHDATGKTTSMDDLVKQGDTLDGGGIAGPGDTESDIHYRWYVVDATVKDTEVTLNKTTGELTVAGKFYEEVTNTSNVGDNGTSYTPREADHGKKLYLVAVGQRNATNAVRTPDEVNFNENPVPIPYPATITLFENKYNAAGTAAERNKVAAADKGNYAVWLWDTANGAFPDDPKADGSKAIPAPAVEGEDGTYKTKAELYPDHTYQIWVSAAKKDGTTEFYLKNSGFTIANVNESKTREVDYYLVEVANTTLSQNIYDIDKTAGTSKLDTIADDSAIFYNKNDLGTTVSTAPTAKMKDKGATTATLPVTNNYVLKGTDVDLSYGLHKLDYNLNWSGGYTQTDAPDAPASTDPVNHASAVTYNAAQKKIETELKLNLYDVAATVSGSVGKIGYIDMELEDGDRTLTFTTDNTATGKTSQILGTASVWNKTTGLKVGDTATFRLPKAKGYVAKGKNEVDPAAEFVGYTYKGTDYIYAATPVETNLTLTVDVEGDTGYTVNLRGEGLSMRVKGDVADDPNSLEKYVATPKPVSNGGQAAITPKEGGVDKTPGAATDVIYLNYNYGARLTNTDSQQVVVTATNLSKQGDNAADSTLYRVTFTPADSGNSDKIKVKTNNFATPGIDLSRTGAGTEASPWVGASNTVTLVIDPGLDVGEHTFKGRFQFDDNNGNDTYVDYTLTVIVEPLKFTKVTVTDEEVSGAKTGKLTIDEYTVERKAEGAETTAAALPATKPNATATSPDPNTALKQTPDYAYQWITAPVSWTQAQVEAAVSWSNGTLTVTETTNGVQKGSGDDATTKTYKPKDADSGRNIFLVIYGTDNTTGTRHNATHYTVSTANVNTYPGIVALKVNDGNKRAKDDADSADTTANPNDGDGYKVVFRSKDDTNVTVEAKWKEVTTGVYAYVGDLIPNTSGYSVEVSRARDMKADTDMVELSGVTIDNSTDVATTIDTTKSNVTEVDYYTVNAVNFRNDPYKNGTSDPSFTDRTTTITPKLTIGADKADLPSGTPVLKNQSVAAKAPDLGGDDAGKAWTQDYTLTWRKKAQAGDTLTITTDDGTNLDNSSVTGQTATAAINDNAYPYGQVTQKTFIGGRLDQKTYKIVGTIDGKSYPGSSIQQVDNVTLRSGSVLYYSDTNKAGTGDTAIGDSSEWKDGPEGKDELHNHNDTVTFTVVAGTYTITGYEAENYTIRSVTVDGGTTAGTKRNENTLTNVNTDTRTFIIHLAATDAQLKVTDTKTTPHTATSTIADNHKHADNTDAVYVYKTLTADEVFDLKLHNPTPGNVDLWLDGVPQVYRLAPNTTVYSDMTTALLTATELTGSALEVKDGNRPVIKFTDLPADKTDVKIGAGEVTGVNAVDAGKITVGQNIYNKDDAIYVVKYASKYTTTEGSTAGDKTGPTVYYVLDLTVDPLPLKQVDAEPVTNSDLIRLVGYDSADATNKTGLDHVYVDEDGKEATTTLDHAKNKALTTTGDISFVWVKAPADKTKADVEAVLSLDKTTATAYSMKSSDPTNIVVTNVTTRDHTPDGADQGKNFFLVAYSTNADSNASEFAVSKAIYARVTVALEARRINDAYAPDTTSPLLTAVKIKTGDTPITSNTGKLYVTTNGDGDGETHRFTADLTDVTAAGNADDHVAAKWYFKNWAANLTGSDPAVDDAAHLADITPVDRLQKDYTVTGKATVIGYYDLLPEIKGFGVYNIGSDSPGIGNSATAKATRTIHYEPNDGSGEGNVVIWIESIPNDKGVNLGFGTASDGTTVDLVPKQLDYAGYFDPKPAIGAADDYILTHEVLSKDLNLQPLGKYRITFFDLGKGVYSAVTAGTNAVTGTTREGGYAGYDRYFEFVIQEGERKVTAQVYEPDFEKSKDHVVKIENKAATPVSDVSDTNDRTAGPIYTFSGDVTLTATPANGYLFDKWQIAKDDEDKDIGSGAFGSNGSDANKQTGAIFTAYSDTTVEALFRKPAFTTTPGHAKIYYGTRKFLTNTAADTDLYKDLAIQIAEADKAATINLTYEWLLDDPDDTANPTALTDYLTDTLGMSSDDAAALVAKTEAARYKTENGVTTGWLDWTVSNEFAVKAAAKGVNVEKNGTADVDNELVVYVKVTEQNAKQVFVIPFTIDIMTSELKIRTAGTNASSSGGNGHTQDDDQQKKDGSDYKSKYIGAYGTSGTTPDDEKVATDEDGNEYIIHGNTVELDKFDFISIDNVNDDLALDHLIEALTTGSHNAGEDLDGDGNPTSIVKNKGYWTIEKPTNKLLNGSGSAAENAVEYEFKFNYTGVTEGNDKDADNYNYTDATIKLKIPVQRPQRDLLIADEVANYKDLQRGTTYSDIEVPSPDDGTTAPIKLLAGHDTKRLGESITYLDEEPVYTAKFQRVGGFDEGSIKLELDPEEDKTATGFVLVKTDKDGKETEIALSDAVALKALLDEAAAGLDADGTETTLKLKLAPVHDKVWVGEHYIRFKLSGTENGETLERWYTLSVTIDPKVITSLNVKVTDPNPTPNEVTGTTTGKDKDEEGNPVTVKVDNKNEDAKKNVPIKDVKVEWKPEPGEYDGKHTEVEVTVEIDPNYIYVKGDDTTEPPTKDIRETTTLTVTDHPNPGRAPKPTVTRDETDGEHIVHITQPIPYLMHDDVNDATGQPAVPQPKVGYTRSVTIPVGGKVDNFTINVGAYGGNVYDVDWTVANDGLTELGGVLTLVEPTAEDLTNVIAGGAKNTYKLNLENLDTSKPGTYVLELKAVGVAVDGTPKLKDSPKIESTYKFTLTITQPSSPSLPDPCPCKVYYHIGIHGTTENPTIEDVSEKSHPSKVPTVTPVDGYTFRGWSLTNPATLKKGEQPVLVDPRTVEVKGEAMTFYAVLQERPFHEHYVIGYPNGNFGPGDDINRASVATIIARAILPGFVEGANYGNPGGYSDVSGHWAESAIAYCSMYGVFEGMPDGTFQPNRPITRQEFALVIARLDGVQKAGEMTVTDVDEIASWALDGVYTTYLRGWVNGYPDGTFKPLNNIRRDEAVKVFNAYLHRGVDANGLRSLHEYVYPNKNDGSALDEYKTWPDVPSNHWAYYEIIEAANDHEYEAEMDGTYTVPETWDKCWIDARWGLSTAGGSAAIVSSGFQVWFH